MPNRFFLTLFAECEIVEQGSQLEATLRDVREFCFYVCHLFITRLSQQVHSKTNPNYSQFIVGAHIAILKMKIVSGEILAELKHLMIGVLQLRR
jgi:hypothetical protein